MNFLTHPNKDIDWIIPGDQYNNQFKTCQGPLQNGQFSAKAFKEKRKIESTFSKHADSVKFNIIHRKVNMVIPIK